MESGAHSLQRFALQIDGMFTGVQQVRRMGGEKPEGEFF